jgi:SAM-dependent methyltransferase
VEWDEDTGRVYWRALKLRSQFPGARMIRVRAHWHREAIPNGPAADIYRQHLKGHRRVVDVGGGDRYWMDALHRLGLDHTYKSADLEPEHAHDYSNFLDITDRFEAVLMFELLEHLPVQLGLRFLQHAYEVLEPGGVLAITTPNPRHPHRVWSSDFTHIRPWPDHDLWAVCKALGFRDVEVIRQLDTSPKLDLVLPLRVGLSKLLGVDPAGGLLAFAQR